MSGRFNYKNLLNSKSKFSLCILLSSHTHDLFLLCVVSFVINLGTKYMMCIVYLILYQYVFFQQFLFFVASIIIII